MRFSEGTIIETVLLSCLTRGVGDSGADLLQPGLYCQDDLLRLQR
jgi:hypothetical protein